jgi:hypothetical protein
VERGGAGVQSIPRIEFLIKTPLNLCSRGSPGRRCKVTTRIHKYLMDDVSSMLSIDAEL